MNKQIIIILLLVLSVNIMGQTQTEKYETEWNKVEAWEKKDLPKSASATVDIILNKAIADNNNLQVIKALIYKNKYKKQIDSSDNQGLFSDLENLIKKTTDIKEKAILHSMLAELYSDYYSDYEWKINQITELSDFVPEDMKEWSSNIFRKKIIDNLDQSIINADVLTQSPTKDFDDIIALGTVGTIYYPTLYDFLMERVLSISKSIANIGDKSVSLDITNIKPEQLLLPAIDYVKLRIEIGDNKELIILNYYQQYLKYLLDKQQTSTIIITEINRVEDIQSLSEQITNKTVLDTYINMEKIYERDNTSAELIAKIADECLQQYNDNTEAYKWLKKGIEKYSTYQGIAVLKNKLAILEYPSLEIVGDLLIYPNTPVKLDIHTKNIQALSTQPEFKLYRKTGNGHYTLVKDFKLNLTSKTTYNVDTIPIEIGALPFGKYCFTSIPASKIKESESNGDTSDNRFDFTVSALMSFTRNGAPDEYEVFVVDRLSGKPIKDAIIKIYPSDDIQKKIFQVLKTDEMGIAKYKRKSTNKNDTYGVDQYTVELGEDNNLEKSSITNNRYQWDFQIFKDSRKLYISIFTDRSIYRPGQTVYFKSIILNDESEPVKNQSCVVKLYNANDEEIAKKELTSNDFGSVAGEFILPQQGLSNTYRIEVLNYSEYVRVEEYKRPTFEVTFDKVEKTYSLGEEIKLKAYAKNFSGISLQGVDVKYNITRNIFSLWRWNPRRSSQFANGIVKTNDDGSFEIIFTPEAGDDRDNRLYAFNPKEKIYTFNITATVTDINGEVQSNTYNINVGNVSMTINLDIPQQIEKSENYELNISASNLQGVDIKTTGSYTLYSLDDNDSIRVKVLNGTFNSGKQTELQNKLKSIESGKYRLLIQANDDKNNEVSDYKDFVIFSYNDKKPPIKTNTWLVKKNTTFGKGDKLVEIIYGSTDKDSYVLYQLYNNKQVFERKIIELHNQNKVLTIPYFNEYGEEIYASFTQVKDGKLYNQNIKLQKEEDVADTKLNVKLEVFRDKLRPGKSETWTISVKDTSNAPVIAELLASMYDTSLDKIYPNHKWIMNKIKPFKEYLYSVNYQIPYDLYIGQTSKTFNLTYSKEMESGQAMTFDKINWFGYLSEHAWIAYGYSNKGMMLSKPVAGVLNESAAMSPESAVFKQAAITETNSKMIGGAISIDNSPSPQIRQNFNETAFFYPQLKTNDKGETLVTFSVPESNTTWRFRALAHDMKSRVGILEQMVVTRKELMVTPNMPRFIRQGDKTSISTKISNLSGNNISGNVRIEFFDPLTDKIINLEIAKQDQSFSIEKDASTSANWTFSVPSDIDLLGCRIVAQNETFSDGEQHVLAVLSNRLLVTESMPIDNVKDGKNTFTMDKLEHNTSSTISNYRLTLEYASNPAWYAIQALPTLSNPTSENAISWFASYYVNTLGASILKQYPKVSAVIQGWIKQGADKQTLISKLQKDQELKAVLQEETPWVLEGKNETEQMQRLSLLFDLNNTKQLTDAATQKLEELMDNKDKAWAWYKGFYGSRSITQYILYGYAKLQNIGQIEYTEQIKAMQINGLKFIDKQIAEDFENLKKSDKNWEKSSSVSTSQIEFTYVRSFYRDIPISQEAREAERFYTDIASKNWLKLNIYERSLLSIVLRRNGDKAKADEIANSIKENAISNKQGMYWANNRCNVFMSRTDISTHTFIMDALREANIGNQDMNAMKLWLINQKRTQVWETTHATLDAINELLSSGSDWFTAETTPVSIKIGDKKVEFDNKEAGTGYVKQVWNKSEITNKMAKVEIETSNSNPAFGALYWQYYEDIDKISAKENELSVNKLLLKEDISSNGKQLSSITENNPLRIGDKVIIRLTIKVDRDMDFVSLKDMRAPCFEPQQSLSGTAWKNNLIYYQSTKDASTNFYFDHLSKGTYVLEYPVYVNRSGEYANGITTIQCMYAPEFISHTQGITVKIKE